jgi:SAM-dependent methyltransferase
MRFGLIPDNFIERLALKANLVPEPLVHTQTAFTMARTIMAAVQFGVFDCIGKSRAGTSTQIATECRIHPKAIEAFLGALVGCGYLSYDRNQKSFSLKPIARKWLIYESPHSLNNKLKFQFHEWDIMERLEEFLQTGKSVDLHADEDDEKWRIYQAGMVDFGKLVLNEMLSRTRVPKHASRMLDIGGSGGTYSAAFLNKYPDLKSRILDLPSAVPHAKPFVEKHGLGERLEIVAGNAVTDDLGAGLYDFVFMGNVSHHLNDEQNLQVAQKVWKALRPAGVFAIAEFERSHEPNSKNQLGGLMDLYFCLTSESGTWSVEEMNSWLSRAGFRVEKPIRFRSAPGFVEIWGTKI